jgi:hypothetical protein
MAKCPHCGKELEFTVTPRKPKLAKASKVLKVAPKAKSKTAPAAKKAAGTKAKAASTTPKKDLPKRPLLKNPDFLNPGT